MKKVLAITVVMVMLMSLAACAGGNGLTGTWTDETGMMTLKLKADGTGTLEAYIALMDFTTTNDITYTVNGDEVEICFLESGEYETATLSDGVLTYLNIHFTKK